MAATFDPSLADAISRVRMKIGDWTNMAKAQVQNETITATLADPTINNDETRASIQLLYALAAKWSAVTDAELDNQEIKASHMAANYLAMAKRLEVIASAAVSGAASNGGIIVTGLGDCRGPDLGSGPFGCCYP